MRPSVSLRRLFGSPLWQSSPRPDVSPILLAAERRLTELEHVSLPQLARDVRHLERTWRGEGPHAHTIYDGDQRYVVEAAGLERLQGVLAEQHASRDEAQALRELMLALRVFEFGGQSACSLLSGLEAEEVLSCDPPPQAKRIAALVGDADEDYRTWLRQYRDCVLADLSHASQRPVGMTSAVLTAELDAVEKRLGPDMRSPTQQRTARRVARI